MFLATRALYQSCDGYSPGNRKSECRLLGFIKTCQCLDGYVDINGHCVKCKYLTVNMKCYIYTRKIKYKLLY